MQSITKLIHQPTVPLFKKKKRQSFVIQLSERHYASTYCQAPKLRISPKIMGLYSL